MVVYRFDKNPSQVVDLNIIHPKKLDIHVAWTFGRKSFKCIHFLFLLSSFFCRRRKLLRVVAIASNSREVKSA